MEQSQVRQFMYLVHDLARHVRRWQERISQEQGLTMPQMRAVAALCKHDGVSQTELARLIESDPMTLSGIVERLEAKGLVRRAPHPTDSRAKTVEVTDKARALLDEVRSKGMAYEPVVFADVSERDLQTTFSVLKRVESNLHKTYSEYEEV